MNYCILNGKKSTLVKGLMIQSLPPIIKPMMRTRIDEIDGRDGDIITKLGYSAYDREMLIGLYGDYDIDEIIAFFNTEGTAVFSNELDKYYNYQIIKEINFERLIRFKQAVVTFHVQPFKYPVNTDGQTFVVSAAGGLYIPNNGNVYSKPTIKVKNPQHGFLLGLVVADGPSITLLYFTDSVSGTIVVEPETYKIYYESTGHNAGNKALCYFDRIIAEPKSVQNPVGTRFGWNAICDEIQFTNMTRWI